MHNLIFCLTFVICTLTSVFTVNAQEEYAESQLPLFDSIAIEKLSGTSDTYVVQHPVINMVSIQKSSPKKGSYTVDQAGKDFLGDISSLFLGGIIFMSSSTDKDYVFNASIDCMHQWLIWEIEMFCTGELHKEKHREKNMDGSVSVNTTKTKEMYWENGAIALLSEAGIPIGRFEVALYPGADSQFREQYPAAFDPLLNSNSIFYRNKYQEQIIKSQLVEYAVVGVLRNEPFMLISNRDSRKTWLYMKDRLAGIFQADFNDLPLGRKQYVIPYLLVNKGLDNQHLPDLIRLAMVSRYLTTTVNRRNY